jgi:hemolysin III
MALLGVVFHAAAPSRAQRLSAPILLAMGWLGVVAVEPLLRALHPEGVLLLLAGGLAYSLGVVFYAWQRPYHHAIWHLFVLGGSLCHYSCVLGYVIPPA